MTEFASPDVPFAQSPASLEHVQTEATAAALVDRPVVSKARMWAGRLAMTAVCLMPPTDLVLSDGAIVKALRESDPVVAAVIESAPDAVQEKLESPAGRYAVEDVMLGLGIFGMAAAMAAPVLGSKKIRGAFNGFDEYVEKRQSEMGPARKAVSVVANAPFNALYKVANFGKKVGAKIRGNGDSKLRNAAGNLVQDTLVVNGIGSTGMIMEEQSQTEERLPVSRVARISGLIAVSWLGLKAGVEQADRLQGTGGDFIPRALHAIGRGYDTLTSVDTSNPLETPYATSFLGTVAIGLAITGYNMAKYQEQKPQQPAA